MSCCQSQAEKTRTVWFQIQGNTHNCGVKQLRWRGCCSSRSDREGPFWLVGQLPRTQASTFRKELPSARHRIGQPKFPFQLSITNKMKWNLLYKKKSFFFYKEYDRGFYNKNIKGNDLKDVADLICLWDKNSLVHFLLQNNVCSCSPTMSGECVSIGSRSKINSYGDELWKILVICKDVTSDICSLALVIYTAIAYAICWEQRWLLSM